MINSHQNSVIFRDVDQIEYIDFTYIGTENKEINKINLYEFENGFILGDAIYYDITTNHYRRALANNTIMSEVIGVVSKIIDKDNFELTLKGDIILDRYKKNKKGTILYLSPVITGKLIELQPDYISKIIAVTTEDGITVDIQRGYDKSSTNVLLFDNNDNQLQDTNDFDLIINDMQGYYTNTTPRFYTEREIQEIITEIMINIY